MDCFLFSWISSCLLGDGEEGGVTVFGKASGWDVGVDDKELLGLLLWRDEIVALCTSILRTASEL